MRWLVLVLVTGCAIGMDAPPASPPTVSQHVPPHVPHLVTSEMLDHQNPAADTKNNKQLSRTEGAPPFRNEALEGWTEVAAGAFQILLGR
jgi:hypothetical protein